MEAGAGIEPAIEVLQTSALPLGYPAIYSGEIGGMREETKGFRSAIRPKIWRGSLKGQTLFCQRTIHCLGHGLVGEVTKKAPPDGRGFSG